MRAVTLALVGGHTVTCTVDDHEALALTTALTELWTSPDPAGVLTVPGYPGLLISARDVVMADTKEVP